MAIPKIKATYSLDVETTRLLEQTARRWGVSKSEVLRRAIRSTAKMSLEGKGREALDALDRLQHSVGLDPPAASRWAQRIRAERSSSSGKREADQQ